jgi:hypothetical protein
VASGVVTGTYDVTAPASNSNAPSSSGVVVGTYDVVASAGVVTGTYDVTLPATSVNGYRHVRSGVARTANLYRVVPGQGRVAKQSLYRIVNGKIKTVIGPGTGGGGGGGGTATVVKPLMGVTGGSQSAFDTINGIVGPVRIRRTYNSTVPASWAASAAGTDVGTGRWSVYSIATVDVTSATLAKFSAFLDTIPVESGVKKIIHIKHEPEDEIKAGTFTLAAWGAAQDAYGGILRGKGRADLLFGPCFQGPYTFDSTSPYYGFDWLSVADESLWDVVGLDPYRTSSGKAQTWEQLMTVGNGGSSSAVQSTMAKMIQWGKPVILSEFGVFNKTDGSGVAISEAFKISLIQSAYSWGKAWNATHPPGTPGYIYGMIYFNYTLIGSDEMLSTTAQQQAYAAIVADSKV